MSCLTKLFYSHNHSNVTQEMAGSQNDSCGHFRYTKIPSILGLKRKKMRPKITPRKVGVELKRGEGVEQGEVRLKIGLVDIN